LGNIIQVFKTTAMGKQKGVIPLKGRVGELIFYTTQYGQIVRSKGSLSRERIARDPSFRTREQNSEFGNAVRAAKLLRDSVCILGADIFDNRLTPRLNKIMNAIKSLDDIHERGKRTVATGITHPEARVLLEGFNFNENAIFSLILSRPFSFDLDSKSLTLDDFASRKHELLLSGHLTLAIDHTATNVVLTPAATSIVTGTALSLVKITFLQEVNGVEYLLRDKAFNGMVINCLNRDWND
jgi:hypothetical protein